MSRGVGWLFLSLGLLSSCTLTTKDWSLSLMHLAPGEDVQSATTTVVGIQTQPLGYDGPTLQLGYVRSQRTRVPAFDEDVEVPTVRNRTIVDEHGILIGEELVVEESRGLFGQK